MINYDLKIDLLNDKSMIQFLFENKKVVEAKYLVKKIIEITNQNNFWKIIVCDMPILMLKKINIHDFLDISAEEENEIYKEKLI